MANASKDATPTAPPLPTSSPRAEAERHSDMDLEALRAERSQRLSEAEPYINEQMQRSREIEMVGVEAWKATQDQRPIEEQPVIVKNAIAGGDVLNTPVEGGRKVPGISHPTMQTPERAPIDPSKHPAR